MRLFCSHYNKVLTSAKELDRGEKVPLKASSGVIMELRPFPSGWNVKIILIRGLQPFQNELAHGFTVES